MYNVKLGRAKIVGVSIGLVVAALLGVSIGIELNQQAVLEENIQEHEKNAILLKT